MDLQPGDRLGPYEVLALIGVGGMGEVYKARDTRLDRIVALKRSKAEFTARFEREANAIAKFNHKYICQLYDVGPNFLVMELIDGVPLKGPLPVEKAVEYAGQILDALDAAHRKGMIHHDLKPANIMVTKQGIKLLDFGLAKRVTAPKHDDVTMAALTAQGQITGTLQYMAPEQLQGADGDARSDIFSFGCVLYEMLSGTRAFEGASAASVIAAIIEREPEPLKTTPPLDRVIRTCLAKDPDERFQNALDLKRDLLWAMENSGTGGPAQTGGSAPLRKAGWVAAGACALLAAVLGFVHFREKPPVEQSLHLTVPIPGNSPQSFVALSPDGRRLAIRLIKEGTTQLWIRALDSPQVQPLPGTDNSRGWFWSPDSKFIGFFADGKLKIVPAAGGPPQALCDGTGVGAGGTWNRAGVILFSTSGVGEPLQRVNASGGVCTALAKPEDGTNNRDPEFLPDGKHFVYVNNGRDEAKHGLYLSSLDNPAPRRLLADVSSALFVPSATGKKYGYLLFLRGPTLMAQPFNAETLQLVGDVFPVAADASFSYNAPLIAASASANGILAYATNNLSRSGRQLTWLDRSGKELGKVGNIQEHFHVGLSPDGKTAATLRRNDGIWLYDVQRGGETRFTSPPLIGRGTVWSPDGSLIAFGSDKGLYLKDASGGSKEELLLENANGKTVSDWSGDGRYLIYTETDPKSRGDIWYLPDPLNKSSERKPVKFQGTDAGESQGQLSPDGRWLAYVSDESGGYEVYVRPFPSGPGRWKVSTGQARNREPRWRLDGKELYYLEFSLPVNRLMSVPVQSGPRGDFQASAPQPLFEFRSLNMVPTANIFLYSPSADGQRFLVNVEAGDAEPTLNVITNWEKAALGSK